MSEFDDMLASTKDCNSLIQCSEVSLVEIFKSSLLYVKSDMTSAMSEVRYPHFWNLTSFLDANSVGVHIRRVPLSSESFSLDNCGKC